MKRYQGRATRVAMKLSAAAPRQWLAGPQGVEARGPDVDMSALRVLVAKPLDRLLDLDGAAGFAIDWEVMVTRTKAPKLRKYTSFDEMKADEYRYWQSRPVHERLNTAAELSVMAYQLKEPTRDVQSRLQRTLVRVQRAPR